MGESDARSPDPGRGRRGRRGGGIDPDGGDRRSGRSPLGTDLVGAQEVPPADPDGSGTASLTLNPGQQSICYELTVQGILLPATAAHIHKAPEGVNGPVVVPLSAPNVDGLASGCVDVDRDLVKDILKNPDDYYVNVHNTTFPGGAVRGQLSR